MLFKIQERRKINKFLKKLFKDTDSIPKEKVLRERYNITLRKLQNLVNNGNENYTDTQIKNIKKLFEGILKYIVEDSYSNLCVVASHNIAVSDFVDIAEKLKIDQEIIEKAVKK